MNQPSVETVVSQKKQLQKNVSPATYPRRKSRNQRRLVFSPENRIVAHKGTRAIQMSHVCSSGGKAAAPSKPLVIAASHGQSRSNRLLTSTAPPPAVFFRFAPPARIERIFQVMHVRWIHAKGSALHILQRPDIHLSGEEVAHRQQPSERINKFAGLDFFYSIDQEFSCHGRAGQANRFQNCNFAAAQLDLMSNVALLTVTRASSSELFGEVLLRVFLERFREGFSPVVEFRF